MDLKNPTRTEALLANIAGYTGVPVPDMKNATRSERLLKEILDNGGGGGGDVTKEYVDTAIADAVADIDDDISALSDTVADKVDKVNGKSLSTNDYTDADKALVQDSPITVTATTSPISTANGKPRAITIYGKSEVVDGVIKSAGEGYAVVDLGTLDWLYDWTKTRFETDSIANLVKKPEIWGGSAICEKYQMDSGNPSDKHFNIYTSGRLYIKDTDYTNATAFKTAMSGVLLCYELADPTQGNAIAIKTDDGTGIDGTMATFSTGTPLRGIPDTDARDVMTWDGSAGTVTKNCGEVDLGTLTWSYNSQVNCFISSVSNGKCQNNALGVCTKYESVAITHPSELQNKQLSVGLQYTGSGTCNVLVKDTDYTTVSDFVASLGDAELIYELATPTTEQLTSTENASIAGLRTFAPTTHAQNNAGAEMTVEAYAGTANGQAISDMQPTRSPLLTLSASGWTNNAQTVTYEHDIGKRNTIDVEPTSIKAWTAAGILATAETASTITFECDTVPTADLSFRITSMEVR